MLSSSFCMWGKKQKSGKSWGSAGDGASKLCQGWECYARVLFPFFCISVIKLWFFWFWMSQVRLSRDGGNETISHYPGADANTGADHTPTCVEGRKHCIVFVYWLLWLVFKWGYHRLWNTAMLHSIGKSEVNRCADENQRWAITGAWTQILPSWGWGRVSYAHLWSGGVSVVLDWRCLKWMSWAFCL